MIEDPLYLDKNTKVFMIGDYGELDHFETSNETFKSWKVFGYDITRYDVNNCLNSKLDFKFNLPHNFEGKRFAKSEAYAVAAILKKMRRKDERYIIVNKDANILKDIPKYLEKESFFPFFDPGIRNFDKSRCLGLMLDRKSSRILFKELVNNNMEYYYPSIYHMLTVLSDNTEELIFDKNLLKNNLGILHEFV